MSKKNSPTSSRNYLSSLKRIITGTGRTDAVSLVEQQHKQIAAIDKLIAQGYLTVDIVNGIAAISPTLHGYYLQTIDGDETKLYRGFCLMLRLWINFQRAYKKGDLLRMFEEGDYDGINHRELAEAANRRPLDTDKHKQIEAPSLPSPTLSPEERREWLETYIKKRYGPLDDTAPLHIVAVGSTGRFIATVDECTHKRKITFHVMEHSEETNIDTNQQS